MYSQPLTQSPVLLGLGALNHGVVLERVVPYGGLEAGLTRFAIVAP